MKKLVYSVVLCSSLALTGCNYLDVVPEDDVQSIESIFEQRTNVDNWISDIYSYMSTRYAAAYLNVGLTGADELVGHETARNQPESRSFLALYIGDGAQSTTNTYCGQWERNGFYAAIRMCNTFLENIHRTYGMTDTERKQWIAEVKAAKAWFYFDLVRRYGPIVLLPENIHVTDDLEAMRRPRTNVDECFSEIIRLMEEAYPDLPTRGEQSSDRRAYFCKETLLAVKAKVLVYAASPLFNGNSYMTNFTEKDGTPLFNTTYNREKWRLAAEACDEAVVACEKAGFGLIEGTSNKKTKLLNTMMDLEQSVQAPGFVNDEALILYNYPLTDIFAKDYLWYYTLPPLQTMNNTQYRTGCLGILAPTMKMVEMYYTENGVPIEQDRTWNYADRYQMGQEMDNATYQDVVPTGEDVLNLHLKREPRFYANIGADRTYWQRGPREGSSETFQGDNMLVKCYQGELFGLLEEQIVNTANQNLSGYWLKKYSFSDVESFQYYSKVVAKGSLPFITLRMAELYLMQSEAWNEYLDAPDDRVYGPIDKVRRRAGLLGVKEAWTQYAVNPNLPETKVGMRSIIQRETNIELAFEGVRFWNLRRWLQGSELNEPMLGWNVVGKDAASFYNNYEGPITVWSRYGFQEPRDYFFPISSQEVQNCGFVQNLGW